MMDKFILDHHTSVLVDTSTLEGLYQWAEWVSKADRCVAKTQIGKHTKVSTVFLALDHGFGSGNRPVLFETMVFRDGVGSEAMDRCSTWEEAEIMHKTMVNRVKAEPGN